MLTLYKRIERLCEERGINITQLSKGSGANRATLSDLKMGRKQSLSSKTLGLIANYFGVTVDYILGNSPDSNIDDAVYEIKRLTIEYDNATDEDERQHIAEMIDIAREQYNDFVTISNLNYSQSGDKKTPTPKSERDITIDDFSIAMNEAVKDLTAEDKQLLLSMARQLDKARKQKNGEKID